MLPTAIDALDGRLIRTLAAAPRAGMLEVARQLGVARGTAQARLDKLLRRGVITGFGPELALRALGYDVTAFTTLEIAQGRLADVVEHLRDIPEVLEAHATSGPGDLHCRVAARTKASPPAAPIPLEPAPAEDDTDEDEPDQIGAGRPDGIAKVIPLPIFDPFAEAEKRW